MQNEIHPELHYVEVTCACGSKFHTHSTLPELRLVGPDGLLVVVVGLLQPLGEVLLADEGGRRLGKDVDAAVGTRAAGRKFHEAQTDEGLQIIQIEPGVDSVLLDAPGDLFHQLLGIGVELTGMRVDI